MALRGGHAHDHLDVNYNYCVITHVLSKAIKVEIGRITEFLQPLNLQADRVTSICTIFL